MSEQLTPQVLDFVKRSLRISSQPKVFPLAGDASSRRYYRIVADNDSFVLMTWEPFTSLLHHPFLNVANHFRSFDIHVPQVLAVEPRQGLFLLEDLGDLTLERKFWESQNPEVSLPFYKKAIDELIKIHYLASRKQEIHCVAFDVAFDTEKLLWEMNYGKAHLLESLCQMPLNLLENLQEEFLSICQKLSEQPRFMCHRDYHSRNLMIVRGEVYVIDFQDARLGPIHYDLVSLVYDSYVNLPEEMRQKLIEDYWQKATIVYPSLGSKEQFYELIQYQMLQRCFKACGSFASFYNQRGDTRYLKYIQPTLLNIQKVLSDFSGYPHFKEVLSLAAQKDFSQLSG
ncbi:MAG: hypothetical protein D6797_00310 [Bdellovibrio sp.]|nr:MAG: hypothetical protein D6797_00310 [Bdellovibrio sp.]